MSSAGILLRVLLALSLILNAIGGALARSEMAETAGHEAVTVAVQAGCHGQLAAGGHAGNGDPSQAADLPAAPASDDCCGTGPCSCACAQLPALAASDSMFLPPRLVHESVSAGIGPARPAPALPHLIRPPIA